MRPECGGVTDSFPGIALRSVKHAWHGFSVILFYALVILGLAASGLYRKLTPNMCAPLRVSSGLSADLGCRYEGQKHGPHGWAVLFLAVALSTMDVIAMVARLVGYVKSIRAGEQRFGFKALWNIVILDREDRSVGLGAEYAGLVSEEPEDLDAIALKTREIEGAPSSSHGLPQIDTAMSPVLEDEHETAQWTNDVRGHSRYPQSAGSERTMFEPHSPRGSVHSDETLHVDEYTPFGWFKGSRSTVLRKVGRATFATLERVLVFAGLMQTITGVVIYTGGCRENWVNGCLAHLISEY